MEALRKNPKRFFSLKFAQNFLKILLAIFLFDSLLFFSPVLASSAVKEMENKIIETVIDFLEKPGDKFVATLPTNQDKQYKVLRVSYHSMTAYNSEAAQCWGDPCITANGFNVCKHGIEDTIAANFLKFGTKVRIPDLFGDRIFIVRDRMNERYPDRVDVWMLEKREALQFGLKYAAIQVVEEVQPVLVQEEYKHLGKN